MHCRRLQYPRRATAHTHNTQSHMHTLTRSVADVVSDWQLASRDRWHFVPLNLRGIQLVSGASRSSVARAVDEAAASGTGEGCLCARSARSRRYSAMLSMDWLRLADLGRDADGSGVLCLSCGVVDIRLASRKLSDVSLWSTSSKLQLLCVACALDSARPWPCCGSEVRAAWPRLISFALRIASRAVRREERASAALMCTSGRVLLLWKRKEKTSEGEHLDFSPFGSSHTHFPLAQR